MWLLSILIALTVLITLVSGLRLVENLESENRAVEAQLHAVRMYDEAFDERVKEMRRFRHDVNGLLQAIEYESKTRGVGDHIGSGEIAELYGSNSRSLVDALVELKCAQCKDAGIAFECSIDEGWRVCMQERGIEETDVQAVAQNLLQNAYEASLEILPESDRLIRFSIDSCDGKLRIETMNRIASDVMPTFETTKADSEQHGIGLAVVKDIVTSYNGSKDALFDPETRLLTMRVML